MNITIKDINALEVLDSRGNPTIEVKVTLSNDICGSFIVPSGASTGEYEAHELRDNDLNYFGGFGVSKAVNNVNTIIKNELINKNPFNQKEIDSLLITLDGTKNKEKLGANAILGVSMANLKACANSCNQPLYEYISKDNNKKLPTMMLNIINGGKHSTNNLDIQEFMIVPTKYSSFKEALRKAVDVYHQLKKTLKNNKTPSYGVGDEGGYAPMLKSDEEALKIIVEAIKEANYLPGIDFSIALDVASSEWYDKNKDLYFLPKQKKQKTKEELIAYYEYLVSKYPICSIEDGLADNDIEGWKLLTDKLNDKIMLIGDDLFVTNPKRLKDCIKQNIANAVLIKLNQIGTFTETMETIKIAKDNNYEVIISHRSGESEDNTISDLCVGTNSKYIKAGAPCRSDRVAKYNQLLRIENEK